MDWFIKTLYSFLAQLVERVTSNDEVSRSSRLEGILCLFAITLMVTRPRAEFATNNRRPTHSLSQSFTVTCTKMSARRQASTTSLSQYVRTSSPVDQGNSLDFCNSFWGLRDQGFDVLSRRMRGAIHTIEEVRGFWKER